MLRTPRSMALNPALNLCLSCLMLALVVLAQAASYDVRYSTRRNPGQWASACVTSMSTFGRGPGTPTSSDGIAVEPRRRPPSGLTCRGGPTARSVWPIFNNCAVQKFTAGAP